MKALRSGWICGNHGHSQETNNICSKRLEVLDWGDMGDPDCSPHVPLAMVIFSPNTQVINRWYLTRCLTSCSWASGFKEAVAANCTAAHHRHSDKVYSFIFSDSVVQTQHLLRKIGLNVIQTQQRHFQNSQNWRICASCLCTANLS